MAIFAILLGLESYYRWSGDTVTSDFIKHWFKLKTEKQLNALQDALQKADYEQMEKYSPLGKKLYLITFLFIIGIIGWHVGMYGMFKKAGIEAWKAFVPFYNTWLIVEKCSIKKYWFWLQLIPIVGQFITIWITIIYVMHFKKVSMLLLLEDKFVLDTLNDHIV